VTSTENRGHGITLGAADEQIGQCEGAGNNSYRSSVVKVLVRLAADPMALCSAVVIRIAGDSNQMTKSLPLCVVAMLLACAEGDSPAPEYSNVLRDSAGVIILEAPLTEPLQLVTSDTATVRIGVVAGDERYQLYEVRGVRILQDRSILVLNAGTHEIRRYSPDGEWLASYGSRGSGPGELQFPLGLTRALSD